MGGSRPPLPNPSLNLLSTLGIVPPSDIRDHLFLVHLLFVSAHSFPGYGGYRMEQARPEEAGCEL